MTEPPLGIMPRRIWLEHRREDIWDALGRYAAAEKAVPPEWIAELRWLEVTIGAP